MQHKKKSGEKEKKSLYDHNVFQMLSPVHNIPPVLTGCASRGFVPLNNSNT